jgi:hypothetical protein
MTYPAVLPDKSGSPFATRLVSLEDRYPSPGEVAVRVHYPGVIQGRDGAPAADGTPVARFAAARRK